MDAVGVRGVHRQVPGEADRDQGQQPFPIGGGQAPEGGQQMAEEREQGELRDQAHDRMRVAAVVQQVSEGRRRDADVHEVEVREVRGHDTGGQEQAPRRGRLTVAERELGEGGAHEGMGEIVHARVRLTRSTAH